MYNVKSYSHQTLAPLLLEWADIFEWQFGTLLIFVHISFYGSMRNLWYSIYPRRYYYNTIAISLQNVFFQVTWLWDSVIFWIVLGKIIIYDKLFFFYFLVYYEMIAGEILNNWNITVRIRLTDWEYET